MDDGLYFRTLPSDLDKRMIALIRSVNRWDNPLDMRPDKRAGCWHCRREVNTFTFRLASWPRRDDEQVMERCGMMCLECGASIAEIALRPVDANRDMTWKYNEDRAPLGAMMSKVDEMVAQSTLLASLRPMNLDTEGVIRMDVQHLIGKRIGVLGSSGKGKSNTVRVLLEEMMGALPITIFDPHGEYSTLGELHPVLHVGRAEDVDAEMGADSAAALARMALEKGVSVVVNMLEMSQDERGEFVQQYCDAMWNANLRRRMPYGIVLEEAHNFIPQGGEQTEGFKRLRQFAAEGRKFGFSIILASQRAAKVDKDVLAQCDMLILHGVNIANDAAAYQATLPYTAGEVKELFYNLTPGRACVRWQSEAGMRHDVVQIRRCTTRHIGDTPIGDSAPKPLQRVDKSLIDELIAALKASEMPVQTDPRDAEIARLREQVKQLTKERDEARDRVNQMMAQMARAEMGSEPATAELQAAWDESPTQPTKRNLQDFNQRLQKDGQQRKVALQETAWKKTLRAVGQVEARNVVLLYEAMVAAASVSWGEIKPVSTADVATIHGLAQVNPGTLGDMQVLVPIAGKKGYYAFNPKAYFEQHFGLLDAGKCFEELSAVVMERMDKRGAA